MRFLTGLAGGDSDLRARLGQTIGFDVATARFAPDSPVIAGTPDDIAAVLAPELPGLTRDRLTERMNREAARAPQVAAVPLVPLLAELAAMDLPLGVATNDGGAPARAHLAAAGVSGMLDLILGSDSGHGGKPGPGQVLAFAAHVGVPPSGIVMVGDSRHDLKAGRAAGARTVAVLTGMAGRDSLAPLADAVLPDVGHLPGWLRRLGTP